LIGIISSDRERELVKEFFELFKTPWEFWDPNQNYDVLLSTQTKIGKINSNLVIVYGSDKSYVDHCEETIIRSKYSKGVVKYKGTKIPIYGNLFTFEGIGKPILELNESSEPAGLKIESPETKIALLGYNLFEEIHFLLSVGQPRENAHIPTLDIHISILRDLILDTGIPLIEIPSVPVGYDFIACLTHDIDFAGIRSHKLDHTMWGFLYRASAGSFIRFLKGKLSPQRLLRNLKAFLNLPFVYLGLAKDFWVQIDKYVEIEKTTNSTFFLIPFKDTPGDNISKSNVKRRSTKYDISDIRESVKRLVSQGFEIGLHGIDAWHSVEYARRELDRIAEFNKGSEIGIRIHWLFFKNDSYRILEDAGFSYDSTCGYNDAVGFRAGTLQVFRPIGAKNLLEIPLHIQDTALFFSKRMNLSEREALELCQELCTMAKSHGGVLTILWHDRSLAPERLWGDFYMSLLSKIKENKVWFATAGQIVNWFRERRDVTLEKVDIGDEKIRLTLKYGSNGAGHTKEPSVFVRVYHPRFRKSSEQNPLLSASGYKDIPLKGETSFEIPLGTHNEPS
jgi:hypothetical protein